jgi:repressor LexA
MLTERQEEILGFVRDYLRNEGTIPSTREVARKFGCAQPTALKHLRVLAGKGALVKLSDGKWGLRGVMNAFGIPVFGSIPAGIPAMQEQVAEDTLFVDPAIFGVRNPKQNCFWFLRVSGDSMIGENIHDGDLVALIRRDPQPGDIIAALVDDTTTTLKTYIRERGRTLLRAANKRFADIVPNRLESQGVVVGVIRRNLS